MKVNYRRLLEAYADLTNKTYATDEDDGMCIYAEYDNNYVIIASGRSWEQVLEKTYLTEVKYELSQMGNEKMRNILGDCLPEEL